MPKPFGVVLERGAGAGRQQQGRPVNDAAEGQAVHPGVAGDSFAYQDETVSDTEELQALRDKLSISEREKQQLQAENQALASRAALAVTQVAHTRELERLRERLAGG